MYPFNKLIKGRKMGELVKEQNFTPSKIELIKNTVCKDATNDELELFLHACKRTGLDPVLKQIYAVKRFDKSINANVMSVQIGIDGYRLIADRTGKYAPGRETEFKFTKDNKPFSATAFVKKLTPDGTWHEVSATVFYSESVQTKKDGTPTAFWASKPLTMLSKCAETNALKKAFPGELAGLENQEIASAASFEQADDKRVNNSQISALLSIIKDDQDLMQRFLDYHGILNMGNLLASKFDESVKFLKLAKEKQK